jgi:hypothetical protein
METKNFDLNMLTSNFSLIMFGMQGTGKSRAIKNIVHHTVTNETVDEFVIISREKSDLYSSFANIVYLEYNEDITKQFLLKQKNDKTKHRLIIFDCCFGLRGNWLKDRYLIEILYNYKFYNISYILAMQCGMSFTKEFHDNFDYIFMFTENAICNISRLYDKYVINSEIGDTSQSISFQTFRKMITKEPCDFSILILHNKSKKFFTFTAEEVNFDKNIQITSLNLRNCNACICYDNNQYEHSLKKHKGFFDEEFFLKRVDYFSDSDDNDNNDNNNDDNDINSFGFDSKDDLKSENNIVVPDRDEILLEVMECNEIILKKISKQSNHNILMKLTKCNKQIAELVE